jgi:hypothetical protein
MTQIQIHDFRLDNLQNSIDEKLYSTDDTQQVIRPDRPIALLSSSFLTIRLNASRGRRVNSSVRHATLSQR